MADVPKVSVDSLDTDETVSNLQKKLKGTIDMKLKEKDWTEDKKEEFKGKLFKLFNETVELAHVVVKHENKSSAGVVHQEMEPVNKERALEVNKMCAESEDLLTRTMRKRKDYPQKVKEWLQKRNDAELNDLICVNPGERDMVENNVQTDNHGESSAFNEEQPDTTEDESYLSKFKKDSENLVSLSKSLAERKDKAQRLQTSREIHLRMQDNDVYKTMIGKRKLPSAFDSILATPSKEIANDSLTESELTVTSTSPLLCKLTVPLKKPRELSSKDSSNQT